MKQEVFDILLYLFDNYIYDNEEMDATALEGELKRAGFNSRSIDKAFNWIDELAEAHEKGESQFTPAGNTSIRHYSADELDRLDTSCRGFLQFLEDMGVMDFSTRETVIDRVMALDSSEITLEQLKWVVLMVLFNQPGQEEAAVWLEDIVIDEMGIQLH